MDSLWLFAKANSGRIFHLTNSRLLFCLFSGQCIVRAWNIPDKKCTKNALKKNLRSCPGRMRCTNIIYRVHQSTCNINFMDGNLVQWWECLCHFTSKNTDNKQPLHRILQDSILHKWPLAFWISLYKTCCPPFIFFSPNYTVYVWTSSRAMVRSPHLKISPKMGFSRDCDDDATEKGAKSMYKHPNHTEPGTVSVSSSQK